ncbi:hypothetical protein [Kordia sp.]|uniref:hypothetical protein n=1 Tax=Kordia sp. TaxID=1965332 RepID=UPI0025BC3D40|nr:hypothetical protein [Kordia sp.]MCH2192849.1 hypothetical protein [Kordia sp.]
MKKQKKLNLKKIKIASINTTNRIKGGLTMGCNTNNTCPKSDSCIDELTEECTSNVDTDCVTLTTKPPTHHCNGIPSDDCNGITAACGD